MAEKTATKKNSAPATSIDFSAEVDRLGERLIVRLPEAASKELPSRGQVAVNAKMNDHAFDTVLEPDGKKGHWISVGAALEKALGLDGEPVPPDYEMLGGLDAPVEAAAAEALGVAVDGRDVWRDRAGGVIDADKIRQAQLEFYRQRPALVEHGLQRHAERIENLGLLA